MSTKTLAPTSTHPNGAVLPREQTDHAKLRRMRRLSRPVAFLLLASVIVTFLAASAAPTPLYRIYQLEWGFSAFTTTVLFSCTR